MTTATKIRSAQKHFDAGLTLFQENRYFQSLAELKKAEDAFRRIDAKGHPFTMPLPNGVSGLANALALSGRCYQNLGDYRNAIRSYETSLINEKFERKRPFRAFRRQLDTDLVRCYDVEIGHFGQERLDHMLRSDPVIDTSFAFPFSLEPDAISIARLYELDPASHEHFKDFYNRARFKDLHIRRQNKKSEFASMKRTSIVIWTALIIIWAVYGLLAARALLSNY